MVAEDFLPDFAGLRFPLATGVDVDGCLLKFLAFKVLPFNGLLGGPVDFLATGNGNLPAVFLGEVLSGRFLGKVGVFLAGVRELLLLIRDACFSSNVEWVKKPELKNGN